MICLLNCAFLRPARVNKARHSPVGLIYDYLWNLTVPSQGVRPCVSRGAKLDTGKPLATLTTHS